LGLGSLVLRDRERIQPRAGRLDLLLQDTETYKRYEVELQLGNTDETHIIRTVEYWDVERRRYPQYEHCAVLIAEDITTRFLNVVSLFNGAIPLVAIQMQAFQVGEHVTLVFTKVMDEFERGLVDEDEDAISAPTDRNDWESKNGTKATVALADRMLELAREFDPSLELKYNKFYIGLSKNGQAYNFISFRPKKQFMIFELKLPLSDEVNQIIDTAGLETREYNHRWNLYRIRLTKAELDTKQDTLRLLIKMAHNLRAN
jgi:predicted transport protein